jgi:hypothetical protein
VSMASLPIYLRKELVAVMTVASTEPAAFQEYATVSARSSRFYGGVLVLQL